MKLERSRILTAVMYSLFFFSGMTGLIYQVTWTRMFVSVFGNTTYAVSAVLSAFMAGLALGSILFGRYIDTRGDELKIYALLELGIGVSALGIPLALQVLDSLYAGIYQLLPGSIWALTAIRGLLSFLVLLVPASLMGATLPVLGKFAVEGPDQVPVRVGLLYALNTLGAALGCLATGFFLLEHLGVQASSHVAVAGNLALAIAFGLLGRMVGPTAEPGPVAGVEGAAEGLEPRYAVLIFGVAAVAGFAALGYEVLWTRLLVFKLKTTAYAFAIMLTTFLAGLGLGSALLAAVEDRLKVRNYARVLGWLQAGIGLSGLGTIYLFGRLDRLFGPWAIGWPERAVEQMLLAAVIMLVPTLLMGAAFPALTRIHAEHQQKIGTAIGSIYSSNTLGAVSGAAITGFVLVRALGTQDSLILMGLLNLGIATVVLCSERQLNRDPAQGRQLRPLLALWAVAIAGLVAMPRDLLFQFYNTGEEEMDSQIRILHAVDGIGGITTIHQLPNGERVISTGSINVAGTTLVLRSTQKLQAHIPMLVHGRPQHVLQIGFGSGETAHILTTYPIQQLHVAEISQSVLDAAARFFGDLNRGVTTHPKFTAFIMDGANYLRLTGRRYDLIMNDSIWPFYAGNSGLYTREHFEAGRARLRQGGVMTSWLPLDMRLESFKTILKTFHSVFPHFSVWLTPAHYTKHALLVGSAEPLEIDVERYLEQFNLYAREDLGSVGLADPILLLDSFAADEKLLADELENVPVHTVDRPVLEFAPSKPAFQSQLSIYRMLARHRTPVLPHLRNTAGLGDRWEAVEGKLQATYEATRHVYKGMIMREERQPGYAREFAMATQLRPDHPGVLSNRSARDLLENLDLSAIEGRSYAELMGLAGRLASAGLHARAEAVLRKAIEQEPGNPRAYNEMGLVVAQVGRLEEAVVQFGRALDLDPEFADAHSNLGGVHNRQKRYAETEAQYRRALELDPTLAEAHFGLGMALHAQGQVDQAILALEESLRRRPDYARAHVNLGILLDSRDRGEEAIAHFREAVRLEPDEVTANNNLIVGLTRAGRVDEAREQLERATRRRVDLPGARKNLVMVLAAMAQSRAQEGDLEGAISLQRQAIGLTPAKLQKPLREQLQSYESRR